MATLALALMLVPAVEAALPVAMSPRRSCACRGSARARFAAAEQAPALNGACGGGPTALPAVEAALPVAILCT